MADASRALSRGVVVPVSPSNLRTARRARSTIQAQRRSARIARGAAALGFLAVGTQRFGFLAGDGTIQLTTLLAALLVVWALAFARMRIGLYGLALYGGLVVAATLISLAHAGSSATSLLLFIVTYAVAIIGVGDERELGRRFFVGAVLAIKVGAVLGIVQWAWQAAGRGYLDPVLALPESIVRSGFNSYYVLSTGATKPNGMIFLEPSFLSLYAGIGIIYLLTMIFSKERVRTKSNFAWLVILAGGLAVSASTSGIVVVAIGLIPLIVMTRRNVAALLIVAFAVAVAFQLGVFDAVIAKAGEGWQGNSSTALRLYYPYRYLAPIWLEQPLFGHGPGMAADAVDSIGQVGLQASTLMKLLVEYGLLGAVVVGLIVARAVWRRAPAPLVFGILAAWLIPSDSLLNGTLVLLLLFAIPQWRAGSMDVSSGDYVDRLPTPDRQSRLGEISPDQG